jgi:hypothetical protein
MRLLGQRQQVNEWKQGEDGGGRGKRNGSRWQREPEGEGKQEAARDDNSCDAQINALDCFLSDGGAKQESQSHNYFCVQVATVVSSWPQPAMTLLQSLQPHGGECSAVQVDRVLQSHVG